jgi:hypothetical protein
MSEEHMTEAKLRHLQKEEERKKQKEKDRQMEENVLEWIEKVISKKILSLTVLQIRTIIFMRKTVYLLNISKFFQVVHKRPDRDYESFIRDAVILSQ